uniref:Uncharacterized protein n=1 Tax=Medicago truncatula TaxID=3880 RepID=A4PRI5_MEDTR|nr:hypothetical protein MtrDRAFT_AC139526g35v2 [Medicago truncatula]
MSCLSERDTTTSSDDPNKYIHEKSYTIHYIEIRLIMLHVSYHRGGGAGSCNRSYN